MIQSYFKTALRHLRHNGRYLVINVLGLGFALGFCILSYLNYRFAHSYDQWHRKADSIFRVETVKASNDATYGVCPSAFAPLAAGLSGVEAVARLDSRSAVVKHGEDIFVEQVHFADPNFLQLFDFELLAGSADLADPGKVLISQKAAEKYFGQTNPIGQTLIFYADLDQRKSLTVSGVVRGPIKNSSIHFDFLTPLDNQLDGDHPVDYTNWRWQVDATFLLLKNPSDAPAVAAALQPITAPQQAAVPDLAIKRFALEPLRQIALSSRALRWNNLWQGMPPAAVWGNLTIAVLLLLTAALNFANMTIAVGNRRLREMGVRKTMGATHGQLMRQLLTEAFVVCALATGLGMLIAYPVCDWFNSTWKFTELVVNYRDPALLGFLGFSVVFVTLLAGSYPAFYLSTFRPSSIFRGALRFGGSGLFSRVMMGLQVAISLIAVVVGMSFARNAEYNRTADVGFERDNLIGIFLAGGTEFQVFQNAVKDLPEVEAVTGTRHLPGFSHTNIEFKYQNRPAESALYEVGNDFQQMLGLQLAEGAWPEPAADTTASPEIAVNEMFAREIGGGKPVIGEQIVWQGRSYRIAGVIRDFMTNTPFAPIIASVVHPVPAGRYAYCLVKTKRPEQQAQVMAALENRWKQIFPYKPFEGFYQNQMLQEAVEVSDNIARSMGLFAVVAILLCITGLFSLVSLNVLQRMREVAIRRVLGASAGNVAWILNKSYLWIFGAAVLTGVVSGRYLALLLMDSIFKINAGVQSLTLLWGALGVLAIATLTITLKIWQTLRVNPAHELK